MKYLLKNFTLLSSWAKIIATFSVGSSRKKNNATSLQSGAYIFLSQRRKNSDYLFTPTYLKFTFYFIEHILEFWNVCYQPFQRKKTKYKR